MLKVKLREYQLNIARSILTYGNTLVVLPTGLGKTLIAFYVIDVLWNKLNKILFLAPTKPLSKQHYNSFSNLSDRTEFTFVSGEIKKEKRKELYEKNKLIFATPQTIKNDISAGILRPEEVSLIVFDEAHRAVGNYAYVEIAKKCDRALIIGLTASPGGDKERIDEILRNLRITNIEIRSPKDRDVANYVMDKYITWIKTSLSPTQLLIKKELESLLSKFKEIFDKHGFSLPLKKKSELMKFKGEIAKINHPIKFKLFLHYAVIIHINHMLELLETQGLHALKEYINKLEEKKKEMASASVLLKTPEMARVKKILLQTHEEHPKLKLLLNLLSRLKDEKVLVFVQYVDQIDYIVKKLKEQGFAAEKFVGKRKGYNKKLQEEVLKKFEEGEIKILVSSSIGEEGIDLPSADVVIFYEPVPSEIRSIQRRGRVGRLKEGRIYILITKGTRDEAFYWAAVRREKKMFSLLRSLSLTYKRMKAKKTPQPLFSFEGKEKEEWKKDEKTEKAKTSIQSRIIDFV